MLRYSFSFVCNCCMNMKKITANVLLSQRRVNNKRCIHTASIQVLRKKQPTLTYIYRINMSRYKVQHGIFLVFLQTSFLFISNQVVDAIHDRYVDVPSYEG